MEDKYKAIELLAQHHSEYVDMVKSIAGNNNKVKRYAEDYVQDAYLKLLRYDDLYSKVVKNEKVSKGYMFFCLRSIVLNDLISKKNNFVQPYTDLSIQDLTFDETILDEPTDEYKDAIEFIESKMYSVVDDNMHWFDAKLFRTYLSDGKTFKQLSQETGLGIQTIHRAMKRVKLTIAKELHDDYNKFINNYKKR